MTNPIFKAQEFGQSIWYDNISRSLVSSGELARLVDEGGVLGVTSNPAIFEKAIGSSADYDSSIAALVGQGVGKAVALFEHLAIADIRMGCDALRGVYDRTNAVDGYVSLEVSPYLANDTEGTLEEARRLWKAVDRENLMIKVPATPAGIPAIAALIGEGINVNVTLLFAVDAYAAVAEAYVEGLETLKRNGGDVSRVASVASFFVSRIDAVVDGQIDQRLETETDANKRATLEGLKSKVAIANAVMAYAHFNDVCAGDRWKALTTKNAMPQRVLWASTGTKSPDLPSTLYVDALIGPHTVNTVPTATLDSFRESGTASNALGSNPEGSVNDARKILSDTADLGINLKEITDALLPKGCQLFSDAFDTLLATVAAKREAILGDRLTQLTAKLGSSTDAVENELDRWRSAGNVRRLWDRDASLWSGGDEADWLGWLDVLDSWKDNTDALQAISQRVADEGTQHVVVMGMGGSSLCPDVLSRTFGAAPGHPEVLVLDSTVPSQIAAIEAQIDLAKTLFIVPSKSGGTIEPNTFKAYFWDKVEAAHGAGNAAKRFVAITDPNTKLDEQAQSENFSQIAYGIPSIGGRFSALSAFGMLPAAALGIDTDDFLARTQLMADSCSRSVPPKHNPGIQLGVMMGTLARQGRDKITIVASPAIGTLGAWLEQLIAESTGKLDRGIVPVDGEQLAGPDHYGDDRLFVYVRLTGESCADQENAIAALEAAGQPVVRIDLADKRDLGQEFYRWQVATAVAGAILEINAFNQPDVEAAKIATKALMNTFETKGSLPAETPIFEAGGVSVYADERNAGAVGGGSLEDIVTAHLGRIGRGDYFAINAYVEMNDENAAPLQSMRHAVRDAYKVATTLGYGPRFLHSTGQLHKGGPNRGVFLQITADDANDLAIPAAPYSFGVLKDAQAQGDFEVLARRERRALRIHLGADVSAELNDLAALVSRCLSN
jgi:transaldolase/glucose-6-phosphate isomerase